MQCTVQWSYSSPYLAGSLLLYVGLSQACSAFCSPPTSFRTHVFKAPLLWFSAPYKVLDVSPLHVGVRCSGSVRSNAQVLHYIKMTHLLSDASVRFVWSPELYLISVSALPLQLFNPSFPVHLNCRVDASGFGLPHDFLKFKRGRRS